jgi:hypothetical protein
MAAATVCVSVTEENLSDCERLPKDSCCKKCPDLETRLQEALKELSSAHLIIELLRNEVNIGTETTSKQRDSATVKKKNTHCDPTEKSHLKAKWSDVVAGRSADKKKEECTSKWTLELDITSPPTGEEWTIVNREHKKPSTVNRTPYYQIPVIINRYEQLRNRGKDGQVTRGPVKTHELETRKEDREKMRKKAYKQKEKKHRIVVIGDSCCGRGREEQQYGLVEWNEAQRKK